MNRSIFGCLSFSWSINFEKCFIMIKISGNEGEIASELNNSLFFIDYKSKSVCVCNQITSTKWSVTLSTLKRHAFCLSECLLNACEMNKIISAKCKKKVYYTPVPNWERCREKKSVCRSEKKWELLYMELHNWFCVQQQITRFCWKEATNTVLLSMSTDLFL